ncbi:MAG TPA: indole-3-glycerol phosphate synthase TrpC [Desulfobacteraceae bacterium]|nr:indole-3-glycerol phosphate synthase TrpC [Desulfobacteraceae bacterium]
MAVAGFIKEVVDLKKNDIARAKARVPLERLRKKAEAGEPVSQGFKRALEQSGPGNAGIIAEIKKASPSKGSIKADLDPALFAQTYEKGGACAVSVLTEEHYFKGSLADLEQVRRATTLPVLRKDFTISEYQIYEAKAAGADAILLIASLLSKTQLADYISLAREIAMEPLVEIHSEWELEKLIVCRAAIIGVNNRNLETLETDLGVSKRVARFFQQGQIPVEASGISSPENISQGMKSSYFNFLVGESIVRAEDPEAFIKSLSRAV